MRFLKGMFAGALFAPAEIPTGSQPTTPSGELTPEQAQAYLEASEAKPTATISPEEATKAFEEAQKQAKVETPEEEITRLKKELEEAKNPPKKPDEVVDPLEAVTKKAVEAGIKVTDLEQEYITTGKLSEESMKSLKDSGFSEEAVQAYISIKENQAIERDNAVLQSIGISSREEYVEMAKWMSETFDEATIAKYDSGLNTPVADVLIEKYYKLYKEAKGIPESTPPQQPTTVSVRPSGVATVPSQGGYASEAEMVKDMQDPRYERDPAYRNQVIAKVMATPYKR